MSVFLLRREIVFGVTYELTVQQRRNRDSEGREDRQMTFFNLIPTFKIYVILYSGQMDRQTDGEINPGWAG